MIGPLSVSMWRYSATTEFEALEDVARAAERKGGEQDHLPPGSNLCESIYPPTALSRRLAASLADSIL